MKKNIWLTLILIFNSLLNNAQSLRGIVMDSESVRIPFATAYLTQSKQNTTTDIEGSFFFNSFLPNDTLIISILGYKISKYHPIDKEGKILIYRLKKKKFVLKTTSIKPKPPTYYIKKIKEKQQENFPKQKFSAVEYQHFMLYENNHLASDKKYLYKTNINYYEPKNKEQESNKNIRQLIKYQEKDIDYELQFIKEVRKKEKKKNENEKMEINLGALFFNEKDPINIDFINRPPVFMKKENYKKHVYEIIKTCENKNNSIIISFKGKRTIKHIKSFGQITIDCSNYGVPEFKTLFKIKIPFHIKSIMTLLGIKIKNTGGTLDVVLKKINGLFYPKEIIVSLKLLLIKKSWFREKYRSNFKVIGKIKLLEIYPNTPFEINKKYNPSINPEEQIYPNQNNIHWPKD